VLPACARLVEELLGACPALSIITTSRQPLGSAGEAVYRVPPLSVPGPSRRVPLNELIAYDAVRLFVERARAVVPRFELTAYVAATVAQICRRLDGIPLAIELAAARADMLTPAQIAERLDGRLDLLRSDSDQPGRHETLEAALDWSYEHLGEPERMLLRRLSVFVGGHDLQAAEIVCGDEQTDAPAIRELLSALVSKSLVVAYADVAGQPRYRLLQTISAYASAKLESSGEAARRRATRGSISPSQRRPSPSSPARARRSDCAASMSRATIFAAPCSGCSVTETASARCASPGRSCCSGACAAISAKGGSCWRRRSRPPLVRGRPRRCGPRRCGAWAS